MAQQQPTSSKGAVVASVQQSIEKRRDQIAKLLPDGADLERWVAQAVLVVQTGDIYLLGCTPESIVAAIYAAAETGLDLAPGIAEAHLVPFKGVCQFIPGYRGLVRLMMQHEAVTKVDAQVVREGDRFEVNLGTDARILHVPKLDQTGAVIGVYAFVKLSSGELIPEWMGRREIDKVRARSAAAQKGGGPWETDFEEMARKTVIRRVAKRAPKTTRMQRALEELDRVEGAVDVKPIPPRPLPPEPAEKPVEAKAKPEPERKPPKRAAAPPKQQEPPPPEDDAPPPPAEGPAPGPEPEDAVAYPTAEEREKLAEYLKATGRPPGEVVKEITGKALSKLSDVTKEDWTAIMASLAPHELQGGLDLDA